jgi:protein-disulfide isomerase
MFSHSPAKPGVGTVFVFCALAIALGQAPSTQVRNASALRPPAGSRVAIVEFADLQCPACAAANDSLKGAASRYKIPWVRHDVLIPGHNWSRNASINARWFDLQGKGLGDAYRNEIFARQRSIETPAELLAVTRTFAADHHIAWPVMGVDTDNNLGAAVDADNRLGLATGIVRTPTVFIVESSAAGNRFTEIHDFSGPLNNTIAQALAETQSR